MDRRYFLGVMKAIGFAPSLLSAMTADGPGLPDNRETGTLDQASKDILWQMFDYIGKFWENSEHVILPRDEFDVILDLKTQSPPSYLRAYQALAAHIKQRASKHDVTAALNGLFFNKSAADDHAPIIAEFIELQMAYGGFRMLGYKNYKGYQGGPFNSPSYKPYRTARRG